MLDAFGALFFAAGIGALLLTMVGLYGIVSFAVASRTREIGVRVALGAGRGQILRLVVGQGLLLAAIGIVVGWVLAAAAMPAARSLLYKVSPFDPLTFIAVASFLATVAFLASYIPARRATRVDPVVALRGE